MVIAVIGLGRYGSSVASTLAEMGIEVLAIDSNEDKVQKFMNMVTHAVVADATDMDAMKSLGIRNADIAVVTMASDLRSSILATMVLKELGVPYVVSKARDQLHGKALEKVGADRVVYPEMEAGMRLARILTSTNIVEQIDLDPNYSILELLAPDHIVGKSLKDLDLRAKFGVNIMAVRTNGNVVVAPGGENVVKKGDILVAIGHNDNLDRLKKL